MGSSRAKQLMHFARCHGASLVVLIAYTALTVKLKDLLPEVRVCIDSLPSLLEVSVTFLSSETNSAFTQN